MKQPSDFDVSSRAPFEERNVAALLTRENALSATSSADLTLDSMTRAALRRRVRESWSELSRRARTIPVDAPRTAKLFGSSTKVEKGLRRGVLTAVLYLSPADESGRNLCPWATGVLPGSKGCAWSCLGHNSGLLAMTSSKRARPWRTALYFGDRQTFLALAKIEIRSLVEKAKRRKLKLAVRFDGSSDTGSGVDLARSFPRIQFYDYTKSAKRMSDFVAGLLPRNYHLTFSWSGSNEPEARSVLSSGGNVAVVFDRIPGTVRRKAERLPSSFLGARVIDGDTTDLRFRDRGRGVVVGLRLKAARQRVAKLAQSGSFVVA